MFSLKKQFLVGYMNTILQCLNMGRRKREGLGERLPQGFMTTVKGTAGSSVSHGSMSEMAKAYHQRLTLHMVWRMLYRGWRQWACWPTIMKAGVEGTFFWTLPNWKWPFLLNLDLCHSRRYFGLYFDAFLTHLIISIYKPQIGALLYSSCIPKLLGWLSASI